MVTTCMLTRFIRSTSGTRTATPGGLTCCWTRPSRNTTPRSICFTTRTLVAQDATANAVTAPSTNHKMSMVTSVPQDSLTIERTSLPGDLGDAGQQPVDVARLVYGASPARTAPASPRPSHRDASIA